jgi:hypothetical protein
VTLAYFCFSFCSRIGLTDFFTVLDHLLAGHVDGALLLLIDIDFVQANGNIVDLLMETCFAVL